MTQKSDGPDFRPHHTGPHGARGACHHARPSHLVAHAVNLVANGMTPAEIVRDLSDLDEEDVRQALAYAAVLAEDELHPLRA